LADFFGGLLKGLKPIMDATGMQPDESMKAALLQSEVAELSSKKQAALADIGGKVYDMLQSGAIDKAPLLPLCEEVKMLDAQLARKSEELAGAQKAAREKEDLAKQKRMERTCPACGEENPEGVKFCQSCGAKLGGSSPGKCPSCGAENAPGTRFCGECGAKLTASTELVCPKCKAVFPPGTIFCGECGARL
jgi:hypothetical protein